MRVVGLITEYNPFHNGHLYHLQKARELSGADYSIAVMSGHFLQRGEPALLNKWTRAEMAVSAGVDLVIELPYVFSCRSAGAFALGSVALLNATGLVTHLCFGSELGGLAPLFKLSRLFADEPPQLKLLIRKHLKSGLILPLAQSRALEEYLADDPELPQIMGILNNPNNILGIEYLRSLQKLKSNIEPLTVRRESAGYHDKEFRGSIASATSVREFLASGPDNLSPLEKVVPPTTVSLLKRDVLAGQGPVFFNDFFSILFYQLTLSKPNYLTNILDITEGLENRVLECLAQATSISQLVELIKTKRYTWTRIQRILNYIITGYKAEDAQVFDQRGPLYIRLLAMSNKGKELVGLMRKRAELPVITKVAPVYKKNDMLFKKMMDYDLRSSDIYTLGYKNSAGFVKGIDFLTKPVLLK